MGFAKTPPISDAQWSWGKKGTFFLVGCFKGGPSSEKKKGETKGHHWATEPFLDEHRQPPVPRVARLYSESGQCPGGQTRSRQPPSGKT